MSELQSHLRDYARFVASHHRDLAAETIMSKSPPEGGPQPRQRPAPHRGVRRLALTGLLVAVVVVIGAVVVLAGRHESGLPVQTGPASTSTAEVLTRILYTRESADGSTVTARVGTVTLPPDVTCTTTPPGNASSCQPGAGPGTSGPGIEFDYVIDGHNYRSVVLESDPRLTPDQTGTGIVPLFGSDDPTSADGRLVILRAGPQIAEVRLAPSGPGGASPDGDHMTPVQGWVTFPIHNLTGLTNPDALDVNGHTVNTSFPFPCC